MGQNFEYLQIEELVGVNSYRDAPDLCYGRCCCEAKVLTGDMRPRETMGMGGERRLFL